MVELQCGFEKKNDSFVRVWVDVPSAYFLKVMAGTTFKEKSEVKKEENTPLNIEEEVINGTDKENKEVAGN